ncbi:class I SAM-dependent methyltransferase [Arthrobacter echini]|uniref:Class I SAM-dependent methyltransferase n=1 Tax=Arthrobacter echini TaxID=1529066 RepID=A0A4V3Z5R5_9MICC|nr:class I SAM-dependent methyltransferase [Arthrobacter echini]THJ66569.1 class I SAM-dependent methyltransferase [Arthrobacter echini]
MLDEVGNAYSRRAAEYTEILGSMDAVHPLDRQLVSSWADAIDGRIIDAGCGPGHWTNFLHERGAAAHGVDLVPEFIDRAHSAYPDVPFSVGSLETLDAAPGTVSGILSWYSLIHHEPSTIGIPLLEFARALRPGGTLLLGFFDSTAAEEFAHAVTPAYRWPVNDLSEELTSAGFDVIETHRRTISGQRPHAAIIAQRKDPG